MTAIIYPKPYPMSNQQHATTLTDHDQIRTWVEERKGKPSQVKGTDSGDGAGILRIDFPGNTDDQLETISWEKFFEKFDASGLALLCQDETQGGETSYFNKFIHR